jgi:release factor glutamine methyltransferase
MHDRVLTQEPHLALFVPDNDPLIFYRTIARFARKGMTVYVEINEALGAETAALFEAEGLQEVSLRKDMQGKDRMIRARR